MKSNPSETFGMKAFANPGMTYRSIPFFSLNDWLDPEEIKRQMKLLKDGGFGGAYLHSRIGILTDYLGEDWWKAMDAGVEAAKELGIEAWFYDEDKWPSGFAGGKTPLASEDFHARSLIRLPNGAPIPESGTLLGADDVYQYIVYKVKMGSAWYNGTTWVDLMNPGAVEHFLGSSYVPYVERYREEMGKVAIGMFTDEPQITPFADDVKHEGMVAFSPAILKAFEAEHGYDIRSHLASLFADTGDFRKIRLHYYRSIGRQFERSFSKPIGSFCRNHGMVWTGHYWEEGSLGKVKLGGGNLMIQYRHMERPGIDHLGLNLDDLTFKAKSLSSVANQYGLERRLSESFGISGQNMSFEDRKWLTDYQAACGINHFCPHLTLYSMKGERKRDYPPTISPQQPYWPYNKLLEDYTARVVYAAMQGAYVPELLILSPLESIYHILDQDGHVVWEERFRAALYAMQNHHRQYDIGDEEILSNIARVNEGRLHVGAMEYGVVVLPPMYEIRRSTIDLLSRFGAEGGRIVAIDSLPLSVDGNADADALKKLEPIVRIVSSDALIATLKEAIPPFLELEGQGKEHILTQHRLLGDSVLVQLSNSSRLESANFRLRIEQGWTDPVIWNPATGEALAMEPESDGRLAFELAPAQSLILTTGAREAGECGKMRTYRTGLEAVEEVTLGQEWQGCRKDPNTLTLDFARYSTDRGQSFSESEPIIGIHQRFTRDGYNGPLRLDYEFRVDAKPEELRVVVEQPVIYRSIRINGEFVSFEDDRFYRDAVMRVSDTNIVPYLKEGVNTVSLELAYEAPIPASLDAFERYGTEIESIYLLGAFAVFSEESKMPPSETQRSGISSLPSQGIHRFSRFSLGPEKQRFSGDLVPQGYPFYAGRFDLSQTFELSELDSARRYFLTFRDVETTVIEVRVNGREVGAIAWNPWEIEITDALQQGENAVTVTLVNSLRNLLGPHHHREGELTEVGPVSFTGAVVWPDTGPGEDDWYDVRLEREPGKWRDDYFMVPFGLLAQPAIISRRK